MNFLRELLTPRRVIAVVLLVIVLVFFSRQLATTLLPFIIGVAFSIVLEPIISLLEKRVRLPRGIAVFATLITAGALAAYGVFMIISQIIGELMELASLLPEYRETITNLTTDFLQQVEHSTRTFRRSLV